MTLKNVQPVYTFQLANFTFFLELVSIPYPNQTLQTNFSKTTRQKLKVKLDSGRVMLVL